MMSKRRMACIAITLAAVINGLSGGQSGDDVFQAVRQGNLDAVKAYAAKDPALLKSTNADGETLLHLAAGAGHPALVDFFVARGIDINVKNHDGQTPLLYAAFMGRPDIVAALLAKGAAFQYQDRRGYSPLHFAAREGQTDVVALFLDKGAASDLKNNEGHTPLGLAVQRGRAGVIRVFLKAGLLDPKSALAGQALHPLAAAGLQDAVDSLLDKGADFGLKSSDGKTMIHSAAAGGLIKPVEKALALGQDIRAKDDAGRTALFYAVRSGHLGIVHRLLQSGADPNADITDGRTLLHIAEDAGAADIMAALKKGGAADRPRPEMVLERYPAGQGSPAVRIAYIANEGFRIASGTRTVLVDAFVQNPWNFDNTPAAAFDLMIRRRPPYERIDLILVSHAHADHFNAGLAVRILEAHPEASLVGNDAVRADLEKEAKDRFAALAPRIKIFNPAWGTVPETTVGGVPLKIFPVNHAEFPQEYQTLAYLMNVDGVVLFHLGDSVARANRKFFEVFGLEKAGIDIAFLDHMFLRDPAGLEILSGFIKPDRIIPMHLRLAETAAIGAELSKVHPSLALFGDVMEAKTFRKSGRNQESISAPETTGDRPGRPDKTGLAIVTYIQRSDQEYSAAMLVDSIRRWGGEYAGCPIYVVLAGPDRTGFRLKDKSVDFVPLALADPIRSFPFAVKAFAAAKVEELTAGKIRTLLWLDPGTLILGPPREYDLKGDASAAVAPVSFVNTGQAEDEAVDAYWGPIYKKCGLDLRKLFTVETFVDSKKIRAWLNCGMFSVRPERGLWGEWARILDELVRDPEYQRTAVSDAIHRTFLHQAVISTLLVSRLERREIHMLPRGYNYPLYCHDLDFTTLSGGTYKIPAGKKAERLNDLTSVFIESLFADHADWIRHVPPIDEPLKSWLIQALEMRRSMSRYLPL